VLVKAFSGQGWEDIRAVWLRIDSAPGEYIPEPIDCRAFAFAPTFDFPRRVA
jgi:hypothetical protein